MSKTMKIIIPVLLVLAIIGIGYFQSKRATGAIKIGVITDLTGPAAYWGESSRIGAEIAKQELQEEGYNVELIYEDYQLDTAKALSAAQKLVNVNKVDGVYAEFNPGAIATGSFLKDKKKLFVFDAAAVSPLNDTPLAYKTYLDYQAGCQEIAKKFQAQGITKIGMLKLNYEPGELCLAGLKEVYGDNVIAEAYNLGDTDIRTQAVKLKDAGVGALVSTGFEGDTLNALKAMQELKLTAPYGTVDDTMTAAVKEKYPNEIKGAWTFGFSDVNAGFSRKIREYAPTKELSTEYGAAITYTHVKQMVKTLSQCKSDDACITRTMDNSVLDNTIGFKQFTNRIADLTMAIKQY